MLYSSSASLTGAGAGMGMAETAAARSEPTMTDFILSTVCDVKPERVSGFSSSETRGIRLIYILESDFLRHRMPIAHEGQQHGCRPAVVTRPMPHPEGGSGFGAAQITTPS